MIVPATNADASYATQFISIVVVGVFVCVTAGIAWTILKSAVGIRVGEEEEVSGLDTSELGMEAYPEFSKG
jgi:Amt family ammonium transporter